MNEMEVLENKKHVLKNVIEQKQRNILMENIDIYLNKFLAKVKSLKIKILGPLVIKSIVTCVSEDYSTIDFSNR